MSNNNTTGLSSPDYGIVRLPAKANSHVAMRFALLTARDNFDPSLWHTEQLAPDQANTGWYSIDLNGLQLPDGTYEYEFVLDGRDSEPVADPFANEITRFGGYRGIFQIVGGQRWRHPFSWDDEFADNVELTNNHGLVIYEMPMRWMESAPEKIRQVGLGTFEKVVFAHLDTLRQLGINAVELLPVQDSADTLNWGYGTRFFFSPDLDMGPPLDLKFFIKHCHRRGIRVIGIKCQRSFICAHRIPRCCAMKPSFFIFTQSSMKATEPECSLTVAVAAGHWGVRTKLSWSPTWVSRISPFSTCLGIGIGKTGPGSRKSRHRNTMHRFAGTMTDRSAFH